MHGNERSCLKEVEGSTVCKPSAGPCLYYGQLLSFPPSGLGESVSEANIGWLLGDLWYARLCAGISPPAPPSSALGQRVRKTLPIK